MDPLRAELLGLNLPPGKQAFTIEESLKELEELCYTAGIKVVSQRVQSRDAPHQKSYMGKGKIEEIKDKIDSQDINIVVVDDELSPAQQKYLEAELEVKVLDRTGLILDIFAMRAQSAEAKLQVELAQLNYLLPRLTRLWTHLSRQSGGIGTRGPGETQLEVDKRQIRKRVALLKKKLVKVQQHRQNQRKKRTQTPAIVGAILGYTNAGKSTLLNSLTGADVLSEDKLFATLDPKTKILRVPKREPLLLSDTVGFIQKLPHQLVDAFRSTLEEVTYADFLVHVVDISHPRFKVMIDTSSKLLDTLFEKHNITPPPMIYVFNKIDKLKEAEWVKEVIKPFTPHCAISALKKTDLNTLKSALYDLIDGYKKTITFRIPFERMDVVNLLHEYGEILSESYESEIRLEVRINEIIGEKIMGLLY